MIDAHKRRKRGVMSSNRSIPTFVNAAKELSRKEAVELANQAVRSVEEHGERSDLVGIKAMCLLSGICPDTPAVMPAHQAIRTVNIVYGNGKSSSSRHSSSKSGVRSN